MSADGSDGAVRKTVTVLFADLAGSTSFGEQVDAESARETLAGYHAMARRVIEGHGGLLAKFLGDGVMALFGVPSASEDDAVQAVATGVELQTEFYAIAEQVAQQYDTKLTLRVGINTGEVVVGAGDDDLVGDAVNTAARLEAACRPGEVLVGEATWRLTRSSVGYEKLGRVHVKGKAGPISIYQVLSTARLGEDAPTPFVGRRTELAKIRSVFDEAVSGRVARLATVIASPGVGKTRLAREFATSVAEVADLVEMRCRRSGATTFAPISDALRITAGIADDDAPEAVRNALHDLVRDLDDAERVADLLTSFLDDGPVRSTEESFFAVRRLTEALAVRGPIVVVVDDIQWAQPLLLDLLEHLVEWVQDASVLIIALARPELRDLRPSFAAESRILSAIVQLDGLDADDTAELASRLLGSGSLPRELLERLPSTTEGNPLFVRELMKMLVDDGVILRTNEVWELTIEAAAVDVPPTIQSLLAARLDRLPPDERRPLELASVVGSEFPLGAVHAISASGTTTPGDLRAAMDRLRRRELVDPTGRYWGDDAVFRFHHALIRDAAYRRILKRRRADLHVEVGEWIERNAEGFPGEHEVSVGYHYERAYDYLRELSAEEAEARAVGRKAATLLGVAAHRSLLRDDNAAAGALAERALGCLDPDDPDVSDLLLIGCEALLAVGDVARGSELLRILRGLNGEARICAWVECFEAQLAVLAEPEGLHDVVVLLDNTANELAELGDQSGVAKARLVRAQALARLGRVGECESQLDVALSAARAADNRRRVAEVLGAAPVAALWGPSPIPRAGGRCLDVIRLVRITGGSPAVEAVSTRCQAVLEALRGRFDTARSMLAEARAMVEELGLLRGVLETDLYSGVVELLADDSAAAEAYLRTAYEGLNRLGLGADAGHAAAYLARALLRLGLLDEADEFADAAERRAGQNPQTGISARAVRSEVSARHGDTHGAQVLAEAAVEMAAATDLVVDYSYASAVLAMAAEANGDQETARRAKGSAATLEERKGIISGVAPLEDVPPLDVQNPAGPMYPPGRSCVVVDHTTTGSGVDVAFPASTRRLLLGTWQGFLSLVELRADGDFHRFAVEEFDRSGDLTRVTLFAPTTHELGEASGFAEKRFVDIASTPPSYQVIVAFSEAMQRHDARAFEDQAEPDFVFVDHRALGYGSLSRGDLGEVYRNWIVTPDDPWFVGDLLEVDAHGTMFRGVQLTVTLDGELDESMPTCMLLVANDRRVERMEWFPETESERALVRFRELAGSLPIDDNGPVVVDHATGLDAVDDRMLTSALRRELDSEHPQISLAELSDDVRGFRRFAVEDPRGSRVSVDLYPGTTAGLRAAANHISWESGEASGHAAVWHLLYDYGSALCRFDLEALEHFVAPNFIGLDHRELPFPAMDRAGLLDIMRSVADAPESVILGDPPLVLTDRGLVQRVVAVTVEEDGGLNEQMPACIVIVTNGQQVQRTEMFPEEDRDRAVARFDELTGRASSPPFDVHNVSTRTADRFAEVFNAGGDLRTLGFTDDYTKVDRRPVGGAPDADAQEMVRASEEYFAEDPTMEIEHLAIRGRFYSLHRATVTARGSEIERLNVGSVDHNGRFARTVQFDGDAFEDALAELDRQWFLALSNADQQVVRVGARYGRAASTWDLPEFEEVTTDDFAYYDGTPLGTGWLDRQRFLESQRLQGELFGPQHRSVFDVVELPRPDVLLSRVSSAGQGLRWKGDWERQLVIVLQIQGDQVHRFGLFAYDDLEVARKWAQDLDSPEPVDEPLDNLARQVARRMLAAMNDGTLPERGEEFFEPDWQRVDHRSIIGTGVIDESTHSREVMALRTENRIAPVAIRGDLFSLSLGFTQFDGGFESSYLVMSEVNPDGRQVRVDIFDEDALDDALGELDRRWRTTLSQLEQQNLATLDAWARTFDDDDTDAIDQLLAPEFWFNDRQQLGAGTLDRDSFLSFHRHSGEVHGRSGRLRHAVDFPFPDVALVNSAVTGFDSESGTEWYKTLWLVAELGGGRVHHTAGFDGDQRRAAFRYATKIASQPRQEAARRNPAVQVADRLARRLEAGLGLTAEMLADDFHWSAHHSGATTVDSDADAFLSNATGRFRPGAKTRFEPMAIRDDRAMLAREFVTGATDPTRLTMLVTDAQNRLVRISDFDPGAADAAITELDRAWWATLSVEQRSTLRVASDFGRAFQEQDHEAFERILPPDFVAVDHGVATGRLDREQYLASHHGRNVLFGSSQQIYDVATLPAPDVMIVRSSVLTSPGEIGWEDVAWNVLHVRDDQLIRLEVCVEMDPDDPTPGRWARRRAQEIIDDSAAS